VVGTAAAVMTAGVGFAAHFTWGCHLMGYNRLQSMEDQDVE